ncbi:HAMP domain-containing histidine kinase [Clostridium sp. LY3-2]|uniref:HAMP domain-containing sensor histidine kinase n=1 Tax=Clostridium sp. LY3-2 TaxID=2942482 RepID=UPI00215334A4|nr:HAMP domain-containing sensor histidine kinase [Clostridium sp. LY3-2]MCR6513858.1 HAMP domain-containing histidine kinase [Clostridium sp. LY3-2]
MKLKLKLRYNIIIGVIVGFFLAQLVISEGYALLVLRQERSGSSEVPSILGEERFFKILAIVVFILTVIIFCTKKLRNINLNKLSIYIILAVAVSIFCAVEFVMLIGIIVLKLYPKFYEIMTTNYFISINAFYMLWIGIVGMFLLTFMILINRKIKYIKYMTKGVKEIKYEGFGKTLEVKGKDELGELCESINDMSIELRKKIDKEKEIENTKNELITNISHDLKTPLTALVGYLELLDSSNLDEETKKKYTKTAYNKSLRLKELVNELFEYTKLTSSDIVINKERFNISNIINQIVGESILSFSERNIEVILDNPYKELYLEIDSKLFTRAIENLVKNAEKYSDSNTTFKVKVKDMNDFINISFENKCEGIKEADLEKIFDKFYRLDKARSSENEGSGLGLNISKRIIELHNGSLNVKKENDYIKFNILLKKA